ncbi:MAG: dTMP kinase [Planctomycetota bacterium]
MSGRFLVIDGPDGSGKTTQAARLAARLKARGEIVTVLREPGGTPLGEAIRELLLDPDTDVAPSAEMLLYQAARAQLVATAIRPALEEGQTLVLDRYAYSTLAYQAYGLGLDPEAVRRVTEVATGGLEPERVFFLDLDPEVGLRRLARRPDRIEARPLEYHRRVREGFLAEARRLGVRAVVLDAARPLEAVAADIAQAAGCA